MLLKFKDLKDKYAIGLRWAVETRQGLEDIQYDFDLNYGFSLPVKGADKRSKLKFIALANEIHDKAIGLAGLLCREFDNLIFVHRISESQYWLCVIKGGEVWMGKDVPRATAGDYVGDLATVKEIIQAAKEDFVVTNQYDEDASMIDVDRASSDDDDESDVGQSAEDELDLSEVMLCSDTAWGDFQDFTNINFIELILKASKFKKIYMVRYLEPSKVVFQKVLLILVLVLGIGGVGYYAFHVKQVQKNLVLQAERERQAKIRAEEARKRYFVTLKETLNNTWGHNVIASLMFQFKYLPLQSNGWELSEATYDVTKPEGMELSLARADFGTVNSFIDAYSAAHQEGKLAKSNDRGTKYWTFQHHYLPTKFPVRYSEEQLVSKKQDQLYSLISYMQIAGSTFLFKLGRTAVSQYQVTSTSFTLAGASLWELKQAELVFENFPTLTVEEIKLNVKNYDMGWQLRGKIYV